MKYLPKAFKFSFSNVLVVIPMFVAAFIPALIITFTAGEVINQLESGVRGMTDGSVDPDQLLKMLQGSLSSLGLVLTISSLLAFLVTPITYGMVNKGVSGATVTPGDYGTMLGKYIVPFILYTLMTIVISIVLSIAFGIIALILGLINVIPLTVIILLALSVVTIYILLKLSCWFVAMVVDDASVIDGMKKSFAGTKGSIWGIIGTLILLGIISGVITVILGALGVPSIPVLGQIITAAVSAYAGVIAISYLIIMYRGNTGKDS